MLLTRRSFESTQVAILLALVVLTFASLLLPAKIAMILTAVIFFGYALIKPFDSLLYLVFYVVVRPILTEINPGLKLIGDIITVALLLRLVFEKRNSLSDLFKFKFFEWAFFIFLAFGALIGLKNGVSIGAAVFQIRTFIIMYLIYYFISRTTLPKGWSYQLAVVTVGIGWLLSLHGLVEKLSIRQWLLPEYWKYMPLSAENMARIYGMPGNPNSLALIMLFTILAALLLKTLANSTKINLLLNVSIVLFAGILILTFSRGTLISGGILLGVYILLSKQWHLIKKTILVTLASIIFVYFPVLGGVQLIQYLGVEAPDGSVGSMKDRFEQMLDQKNIDRMVSNGRVFYLKKGYEVFKDYPVTGSGFGTFGGAATLSYGSPIYEDYGIDLSIYFENKIYSDNQYIQVIAETGAIGVLLFAAFMLGMLALFIKQRHTHFGQFMIGLWLSTFASGMYYNIWELKVYTLIFFILLALFATQNNWYNNNSSSFKR